MAKGSVQIVVERCKACGFCVEFCPTHVLALSSAFNAKGYHTPYMAHPEKCSGCDLCGMYCPDFAIYGFKSEQTQPLAQGEKDGTPVEKVGAPAPNATEAAKEAQDAR
ncbi:MAG TPA: 4Fe-4S dicluster domain-containing protein [Terriglobales bacterium]|nr:4Fe-4S dicluster domain-containing protein [Terriglobales bacterium]